MRTRRASWRILRRTVYNGLQGILEVVMCLLKPRVLPRHAEGAGIHQLEGDLHGHTFLILHKVPIPLNNSQDLCRSQVTFSTVPTLSIFSSIAHTIQLLSPRAIRPSIPIATVLTPRPSIRSLLALLPRRFHRAVCLISDRRAFGG
jgi:hypothetical protein